ncbi:development-specific protein LVN1.2-like [Apostichopus japonicus]|uniref:development-specific protein LVN1.2-like n=1 Tax=Stichopus japonicus TaxID=307972 RepID=UPI003AB62726
MKIFATVCTLLIFVAVGCSQQRCCQEDKQYECTLGGSVGRVQNGTAVGLQLYYDMAVDFTGQRVGGAGYITVVGNVSFAVQFIQLWKQKKQYTIVNDVCTVAPLDRPEPSPCIPSSATFIGYSTQGKNELTIQSWSLAASDVGLIDGHGYLSVSNVTCVPLGVSLMGRQKSEQGPVPMLFSGGHLNYTSGIPDPGKWFDLPSSCTQEKLGDSSTVPEFVQGSLNMLRKTIF